jgi:hypothetical protein
MRPPKSAQGRKNRLEKRQEAIKALLSGFLSQRPQLFRYQGEPEEGFACSPTSGAR